MLPKWMEDRIANQANEFLTSKCRIEREMKSTDDFGSQVVTWVISADQVRCRVIRSGLKSGSVVSEVAAQEGIEQEYRIALPPDVVIDNDMRITVDGEVYGVVRIDTAMTSHMFKHAVIIRR